MDQNMTKTEPMTDMVHRRERRNYVALRAVCALLLAAMAVLGAYLLTRPPTPGRHCIHDTMPEPDVSWCWVIPEPKQNDGST